MLIELVSAVVFICFCILSAPTMSHLLKIQRTVNILCGPHDVVS